MRVPPRFDLIHRPTPLHRLNNASRELGLDLWIKRDDLTGLALGGNKGRKLEYLIADALNSGADTVLTCGSSQSNFVRQLGAACAVAGLRCCAVVMHMPYEDRPPTGIELHGTLGNLLLDEILGVEIITVRDGNWHRLDEETSRVEQQLGDEGRKVYRIPIGGSSPLGALAFYEAGSEIIEQGADFDWIVTSSSSGSTQTGLTYRFAGSKTKVLGIAADPEPEMASDFADLGLKLASILGVAPLNREEFLVNLDYVGGGYGVSDPKTIESISWLGGCEGILLDPIYTGKAFYGLRNLAEMGAVSGRVLFWHTGGAPNLFSLTSGYKNLVLI